MRNPQLDIPQIGRSLWDAFKSLPELMARNDDITNLVSAYSHINNLFQFSRRPPALDALLEIHGLASEGRKYALKSEQGDALRALYAGLESHYIFPSDVYKSAATFSTETLRGLKFMYDAELAISPVVSYILLSRDLPPFVPNGTDVQQFFDYTKDASGIGNIPVISPIRARIYSSRFEQIIKENSNRAYLRF